MMNKSEVVDFFKQDFGDIDNLEDNHSDINIVKQDEMNYCLLVNPDGNKYVIILNNESNEDDLLISDMSFIKYEICKNYIKNNLTKKEYNKKGLTIGFSLDKLTLTVHIISNYKFPIIIDLKLKMIKKDIKNIIAPMKVKF